MRSPILMPEFGDVKPTLSLWFVQPGDSVYSGDRLVELLCEGSTFDVTSPVDGQLAEKSARPGEPIASGQILGWIES